MLIVSELSFVTDINNVNVIFDEVYKSGVSLLLESKNEIKS